MLGLERRRRAFLGVEGLGVGDRDLGRPAEDLALGAGSLRVRRVVDLLQHARDHQEVARLERSQVVEQVLDVGGVAKHAVAADLEDLQEAREHVGERQEQEQARVLARRDFRHPCVGVEAQVREVLVAQDRALGRARRAGRVDDGGDVVLREGFGAGEDALARGGCSFCDEGFDGLGIQGEHVRVVPVFSVGRRAHDLRHGDGFGDDEVDVRVDEDVGDLVDGAGLVDGDGDEAGRPAREVEERPLVAGAAHDRDPVARLEAPRDEAGGERVRHVSPMPILRRISGRVAPRCTRSLSRWGIVVCSSMRTRTGACHSRASVVVCACVVSSSLNEAGVSSAVMSAPWSLGGVRCGTRPAALLLLPLSYAPVGWRRESVFRGG